VRCGRCGTLALSNVPPDLAAFYPADYYRVPAGRAELMATGRRAEQAKLALVAPFAPEGRLVEIGPAVGAFLAVSQDAGYAVQAVEMDAACCEFLERELGIPAIRCDDPATAIAGAGEFDVIALWQVIEHLADPRSTIAAAAAALAPGGVLALSAPNPEALQMRVLGARWTHVDAPRHLFLIPLATVAGWGAEHGLEVVLATASDASARGWNAFGWRESLAGLTSRRRLARGARIVGALITRLLAPIERRGLRGATYTVLLRRPSA
jgi:SAM-dependent methyltransferase